MADLLPATRELLLALLDGLDEAAANLPEVRVYGEGRMGARVFLRGAQSREIEGRRSRAMFDELRAAGLLRKLRTEKSGDYYGFTAEAFRLREALTRAAPSLPAAKQRPAHPPPELTSATSMRDTLSERSRAARDSLDALTEVSQVKVFRNDPGSGVAFFPKHPNTWMPLDREHVPLLGAAREATERWIQAARRAIALCAREHLDAFDKHTEKQMQVCVRAAPGPAPGSTTAEVKRKVARSFSEQIDLIDGLPGAVEDTQLLLVPDTNALIADPEIENWCVGSEPTTIVIAAQVVAELDALKVTGNDRVREKANQLIRRFKEYSRRGDTFEGVPLAGKLRLRELAVTPDMTLVGSGLDPDHADDRILAAALALAVRHLTSRVVLVTRDRNMSNKARLLSIPAVDIADL